MVRSTSMPMSRAASWSCAVARMALPRRVLLTIQLSPISSGIVQPTTTIVAQVRVTSPILMPPVGMTRGHCRGADPLKKIPAAWKMKLTPTAVIRAASLGARRSRR